MGCVDQRSGEVFRNKLAVLAQWNRNYGIEQVSFSGLEWWEGKRELRLLREKGVRVCCYPLGVGCVITCWRVFLNGLQALRVADASAHVQ